MFALPTSGAVPLVVAGSDSCTHEDEWRKEEGEEEQDDVDDQREIYVVLGQAWIGSRQDSQRTGQTIGPKTKMNGKSHGVCSLWALRLVIALMVAGNVWVLRMETNRTHDCSQIVVDSMDYDLRDAENGVPESSQVANGSHPHQLQYQLSYIPEKTIDPRELFAMRYPEANESWSCHWNRFSLRTKDYIVANRTRCVDTRDTGFGTVYQRHGSVGGRYVVNVEVFKSATSTLHSVLSLRYCPSINQTVWLSKLQNCIIPVNRGYHFAQGFNLEGAVTAFAVIRHPVKRFISGYTEMIKHFTWCQELSSFCQDGHKTKPPSALFLALNQTGEEPHRFNAFVDLFTSKGFNILEDYVSISANDDGNGSERDEDEASGRRGQEEEILPNNGLVSYATGMLHCLSQMWFLSQYPGRILYLTRLEDNLGSKVNWLKMNVMNLTLSEKEKKLAFRRVHSYDSRWGTPSLKYILKRPDMYQRSIEKLNDYFQQELDFFGYEPLMLEQS